MASLVFEDEKLRFREYYEESQGLLSRAVSAFRALLTLLLADQIGFSSPVVTGRLKSRDECIAKFSRKYQGACEENKTPYEIKDFITDLLGVRVVCLYETDVSLVRDIVEEHFEILEITNKSAAVESHDDTFGYKGLHLDLKLKQNRADLPEYARFKNLRFELQIRTTVQDSWSVLDHKIKYKKNIPDLLKRRINRLAALFELADQEFVNIKDETLRLEEASAGLGGVPTVRLEPIVSVVDKTLNAFSFSTVARQHFPGYIFDGIRIDGFVGELRQADPTITAIELDDVLKTHMLLVNRYRLFQREAFQNRLNPYTAIRHALYRSNKGKFRTLLFDSQRENFDIWLATLATEG